MVVAPPGRPYRADIFAVATLAVLSVVTILLTWQRWGHISVDCGREMLVPAAINEGRRLYFDLWYPYGPAIPHWHAFLFRVFGAHLNVLYAAGIATAVLTAAATYCLARIFLPVALSFAAAFAIIGGAFQPSQSSYILPYSYPAAYCAAFSATTVWLLVSSAASAGRWQIITAAALTGITVATKTEFGAALLILLGLAVLVRAWRRPSAMAAALDIACAVPVPLAALGWYAWLVNQSSFSLIFEQNIPIGANAYFVQTMGARWLRVVGFPTTFQQFSAYFAISIAGVFVLALLMRLIPARIGVKTGILLLAPLLLLSARVVFRASFIDDSVPEHLLAMLLFNRGMVWAATVLLTAAAWQLWRDRSSAPAARRLLLAASSLVIGMRVSVAISPSMYGVFYLAAPYVAWLTTIYLIAHSLAKAPPTRAAANGLAFSLCLVSATLLSPAYARGMFKTAAVATERGAIKVKAELANPYRQVLAFLEGANTRSERWIILPEDTTLYYLTSTLPPNRWYILTPGILPAGELTTEYLRSLDRADLTYIILSNRKAPEYGTPVFGVDWNQVVFAWISERFVPVREIGDWDKGWAVRIYQRKRTSDSPEPRL